MWLLITARSDISNAVGAVARHSHNPTERPWKAVLKSLACLHGTGFLRLMFVRGSVSGVIITLRGAAVRWASSTQICVTFSTTEAEYVALGEEVKKTLFHGHSSVVVYSSRAKRSTCSGFRE